MKKVFKKLIFLNFGFLGFNFFLGKMAHIGCVMMVAVLRIVVKKYSWRSQLFLLLLSFFLLLLIFSQLWSIGVNFGRDKNSWSHFWCYYLRLLWLRRCPSLCRSLQRFLRFSLRLQYFRLLLTKLHRLQRRLGVVHIDKLQLGISFLILTELRVHLLNIWQLVFKLLWDIFIWWVDLVRHFYVEFGLDLEIIDCCRHVLERDWPEVVGLSCFLDCQRFAQTLDGVNVVGLLIQENGHVLQSFDWDVFDVCLDLLECVWVLSSVSLDGVHQVLVHL